MTSPTNLARQRILVADDNHDHVLLTIDAIESLGTEDIEVRIARDGEEALDILLEERWLPSLVLLDIQMPQVDGFGVLEELQSDDELRLLPVAMLTSSSDERDIVRSYGLGTTAYVTKPVDAQALRELVSRIPSYQRGCDSPPHLEVS
jgi:CheY-like chemotaxis protein